MSRTVAVTGATGLIGRALIDALLERGDSVVALVRHPPRNLPNEVEQRDWSTSTPVAPLSGVDAVVHLAGSPVAEGRWTKERKRTIETSRVEGTRSIVAGIEATGGRVEVLVSASGIDIHGDTGDAPIDENAEPGTGFLTDVGLRWEAEARRAGCRTVLLRTGLVLSPKGGALPRLLPPFRLGVGGPFGNGRQFVPWIHLADEVGLILHALDDPGVEGPMLAVSPEPLRNRDFAREIGRALGRPAVVPVPAPILKAALGEMSTVLLSSHNAVPRLALETGYSFRFPTLKLALEDLLR